ncbi:MAG: hypothetical protein IT178_16535 [Acidobacteria bacterium]|nr:hypothetical protein [Acidobacteriota bacterium]
MIYTYFGADADGFYGDRDDGTRVRLTKDEFFAIVNPKPVQPGDTLEFAEHYLVAKFDGDVDPDSVPDDPAEHPQCVEVIRMGTRTRFTKSGTEETAPEVIFRRSADGYH